MVGRKYSEGKAHVIPSTQFASRVRPAAAFGLIDFKCLRKGFALGERFVCLVRFKIEDQSSQARAFELMDILGNGVGWSGEW